mmetsp:Transcript_8620/g.21669  ORF Transcript_8620/g.21669 Transcript_8620/m.21669 type:complete len:201 (+) Transcript_8620:786-1388(+)
MGDKILGIHTVWVQHQGITAPGLLSHWFDNLVNNRINCRINVRIALLDLSQQSIKLVKSNAPPRWRNDRVPMLAWCVGPCARVICRLRCLQAHPRRCCCASAPHWRLRRFKVALLCSKVPFVLHSDFALVALVFALTNCEHNAGKRTCYTNDDASKHPPRCGWRVRCSCGRRAGRLRRGSWCRSWPWSRRWNWHQSRFWS